MTLTVRRMYAYDLEKICWTGGRRHLEKIDAALTRTDTAFCIGLLGEQAVSVGAIEYDAHTNTAQIILLRTDTPHEGEGYATAVLFNLETYAEEHGCLQITVDVETVNERALHLLQRLGYSLVEEKQADSDNRLVDSPYGTIPLYQLKKTLRTGTMTTEPSVIE